MKTRDIVMWALLTVVGGFILLNGLNFFSLNGQRNHLGTLTGLVWSAITNGAEEINTLQNQVDAPTQAVKDIMSEVATARNDILAAQKVGDVEAGFQALNRATISVQSIQENYPDVIDLTPLYTSLMDETTEAFTMVKVARDDLIRAQGRYNSDCGLWAIACTVAGGRVNVLGANSNPAAPMDIAPMGS